MKYILQIGEGNFLRAFAEDYIEDSRGWKVFICQPRTNTKVIDLLKAQGCKYDIIMKGRLGGKTVNKRRRINCVENAFDSVGEYGKIKELFKSEDLKLIISNTTEAGITFNENDRAENYPDISFPAKLTLLLLERYNSVRAPLVLLPSELIIDNGKKLKDCILKYVKLWGLENGFYDYINSDCHFCNTLVDRIVTGHENGDSDVCSVTCEPYKSYVIEADEFSKRVIPFKDVQYTDDLSFYRKRKVRILNGIHTMTFAAAYLSGVEIVRDAVNDDLISSLIYKGSKEIESILTLSSDDYSKSVIERFNNPYIDHKFLDISLNSVAKYRERCLPSITEYIEKHGKAPLALSFSFASLIAFYNKECKNDYEIRDSKDVLDFFNQRKSVNEVLSNADFWGRNLTELPHLNKAVEEYYCLIKQKGMKEAIKEVVYE